MMKIHFTVEESSVSANEVLVSEIVRHIRTAVAPKNLRLEPPPPDGQICIGKMFKAAIDDVKVPCVALIPNAVICLAGIGGNVTRRLESVLIPGKNQRQFRVVSINGVPLRCFVIRLTDFNKSVDEDEVVDKASHPNDDVTRIINMVQAAIASGHYYLITPKPDRAKVTAKVTVTIDGATLTSDGITNIIENRKELERRIERVFLTAIAATSGRNALQITRLAPGQVSGGRGTNKGMNTHTKSKSQPDIYADGYSS